MLYLDDSKYQYIGEFNSLYVFKRIDKIEYIMVEEAKLKSMGRMKLYASKLSEISEGLKGKELKSFENNLRIG